MWSRPLTILVSSDWTISRFSPSPLYCRLPEKHTALPNQLYQLQAKGVTASFSPGVMFLLPSNVAQYAVNPVCTKKTPLHIISYSDWPKVFFSRTVTQPDASHPGLMHGVIPPQMQNFNLFILKSTSFLLSQSSGFLGSQDALRLKLYFSFPSITLI